jgi:hypothetical protein
MTSYSTLLNLTHFDGTAPDPQAAAGAMGTATPVRVAVLVDSLVQPHWARKVVADILASPFGRIVLVVHDALRPARETLARRLWRRRRRLLHDAYVRLDDRIFRDEPDAFASMDLSDLLAGCPRLTADPADGAALACIREHDIDVVVALSPTAFAAYAPVARHGVWSLRQGDDGPDREELPGLAEVMNAEPTTMSVLECWEGGSGGPRVIYRSHGPTDHISVRRNRSAAYWKSSGFVLRKLRDLATCGPGALATVPDVTPAEAHAPRRRLSNVRMASLLLRLGARFLRGKVRDLLTREQWYWAFRFEEHGAPADHFHGLSELIPPKDRLWADPFPVRTADGRYFVFFEELCYRDPKGRIMAVEIDPVAGPGRPFQVLERPYHLSYPQVFEWQGQYYMLPETSANRTVTLFRCVSFPDQWVEERDLLRGVHAVDATIASVDGLLWMFANVAPFGANNRDELHLFHARTLLGPWTPHPGNPVKSDCRAARPAGRMFVRDGALYRPAQNCAGVYGASIVLHRVDMLSRRAYRETRVAEIAPTWHRKARRLHTINRCDGLLVVDLLRYRSRFF